MSTPAPTHRLQAILTLAILPVLLFVVLLLSGSPAPQDRSPQTAEREAKPIAEYDALRPGAKRPSKPALNPWSTDRQTPDKSLIGAMSTTAADRLKQQETHMAEGLQTPVRPGEFNGDVRTLPQVPSVEHDEFDLNEPDNSAKVAASKSFTPDSLNAAPNITLAPMPNPIQNFAGLARGDAVTGGNAGNGTPPDTNGDVGKNHYIQAVNSSFGIYNKTGTRLAAFTENSLWSGAGTGTPCDTLNQGDPVVLYDQFGDRWILTDFAFGLSGNNTVAPYYQCFAVSKTNDPVAGGWWLYAVRVDDATHPWLDDYPKFGIWNDGCLYMGANEFTGNGSFQGTLFASFNRAAMESGATLNATNSAVGYIVNSSDPFTIIPANISGATLSASLPPANTPEYYVSESGTAFNWEVRKFAPGAGCGGGGTMAAATNVSQASYTVPSANIVPEPAAGNTLDSLGDRVMQKVEYSRVGAAESLWVTHTFRVSASTQTGSQWAQLGVTAGTVLTTPVQQQLYDPNDGTYRWMSSIAADRLGNVALGYSMSSSTVMPSIAYAGRLAADPVNTLPQSETVLINGTGVQDGNCGSGPCHRWGDYSSMSVDPIDDCTFWYTNEYFTTSGTTPPAWATRIGSFKFPGCTVTTAAGVSVSGRVTTPGGTGLRGAYVFMTGPDGKTRQTLTSAFGYYSFQDVPSGASYLMGVSSKRFVFASRVVTVNDELAGMDFIAQ